MVLGALVACDPADPRLLARSGAGLFHRVSEARTTGDGLFARRCERFTAGTPEPRTWIGILTSVVIGFPSAATVGIAYSAVLGNVFST